MAKSNLKQCGQEVKAYLNWNENMLGVIEIWLRA